MIWVYSDMQDSGLRLPLNNPAKCPFCASALIPLATEEKLRHRFSTGAEHWATVVFNVCNTCGWWLICRQSWYKELGGPDPISLMRAWPDLRQLDVSDISTPTEELRSYLLAKYEGRFSLNPRRFEEIVAGVFSDFNFSVRVTSYSGDQGIDIVALEGCNGNLVGIQVKRYRNKIEAEQIRSFAGALILNKMTKGIFVTTSSFSKGAKRTASRYGGLGIPIELEDAPAFYDRLSLKTRSVYRSLDDPTTPFYKFVNQDMGSNYRELRRGDFGRIGNR